MNPTYWGPHCWEFLHCICFGYPQAPTAKEQDEMSAFFASLKHILPCKTCKFDFTKLLQEDPIDRHLYSRDALLQWINATHNKVNAKTGKPQVTFAQMMEKYTGSAPGPSSTSTTTLQPKPEIMPLPPVRSGAQVHAHPTNTQAQPPSQLQAQVQLQSPSSKKQWIAGLLLVLSIVGAFIWFQKPTLKKK